MINFGIFDSLKFWRVKKFLELAGVFQVFPSGDLEIIVLQVFFLKLKNMCKITFSKAFLKLLVGISY